MNICIIAPNPNQKDGIAQYSYKYAEYLKTHGQNILLITPKKGGNVGVPYHFPDIALSINSVFKCLRLIKDNNIEIIHVEYAIPAFGILTLPILLISFFSKYKNNIKTFITFHEVKREIDLLGLISIYYFKFLSTLFNSIIVHTNQAKLLLQSKSHIPKFKIILIPLFLYPQTPMLSQKPYKMGDSFNIVYFGYIHIDKGLEFLIEAIKFLKEEQKLDKINFKCIIAGDVRPRAGLFSFFEKKDQNYKRKIIELMDKWKLSRTIEMRGFIPNHQIFELLNDASVFVIPYTNTEQSGILHTVLPYLKPIIATEIGGLKETLHDSGILVPAKNSASISNQLMKLMTNTNYYESFSQNYKTIVSNLSLKMITKQTLELYQS